MASFYNQGGPGAPGGQQQGGGGFYNSGGQYGGGSQQQQFGQQQQPQQSQYNQWQQPTTTTATTQQQQQPQQQMQQPNTQQGQQQQQAPAFWNPTAANGAASMASNLAAGVMANAAASGGNMNEAILGAVLKGGQEAWVSGGARMIPGLESTMQTLRTYFAVDNRYVKRKMQKVLFPFTSKQWRRLQTEGPELVNYALPYGDENAPDLYLPLMSLISYCLLCALLYGTAGQFNPEVIADVTTKCFLTQIFEVLIIRSGFYMMNAPIAMLDLFSYTGYKYLGLTLNMIIGLTLGHLGYGTSGYYASLAYTASAAAYFMLKIMAHNIPTETSSEGPKREVMVLAFAAMQAAIMWFLSQTKFL